MKKFLFFLLFLLSLSGRCISQVKEEAPLFLREVPPEYIPLDKYWKFQAGDNPAYAQPGFNDRNWQRINPSKNIRQLPELSNAQVGWFRLKLQIGEALKGKTMVMVVSQFGASEIYLNGSLVASFGIVSADPNKEVTYNPYFIEPVTLHFSTEPVQVIAVRYSFNKSNNFKPFQSPVFGSVLNYPSFFRQSLHLQITKAEANYLSSGVCLIMFIMHMYLYLAYRERKANLYLSLFTFFQTIILASGGLIFSSHTATVDFVLETIFSVTFPISWMFYLLAVYELFYQKKGIWFKILIALLLLMIPIFYYTTPQYFSIYMNTMVALVSVRIVLLSVKALQRKLTGAKIFIVGQIIFLFVLTLLMLNGYSNVLEGMPKYYVNVIAALFLDTTPPVCISIVLAKEVAQNNRSLKHQLEEIKILSQKTLLQEKEKQEILATQKERLEQQVTERTSQLKLSMDNLKATQTQLIQKEKMASLGELTAGIAHEIQNPLNFVNNFSEVSAELVEELKQETLAGNKAEVIFIADDLKQNLIKISLHGHRADAIVKNMLQHSRANSGEKQPTDLNALADEYLRLSYHEIRAKNKDFNANLITDFDKNLSQVEVVPQDLGRVLLNLFNNAFYSTQQKKAQLNGQYQPEVKVSTCQENGRVEIKVWDNGTGIPENVKNKIFQPFFTTKPTGQGTGLGLSLSYDIITKGHNGEIKVATKESEFTEMVILLPVKD